MSKLPTILLQLTAFLIPTNLALHWYLPQAYVSGHLIDYLLPRLYLSDLPLLILLILNLKQFKLSTLSASFLPLFSYLLFQTLCLFPSWSSLWFLLKIFQLAWFYTYLRANFTLPKLLRLLVGPLCLSLFFQTSLALYQYIQQREFIGYFFLGEPHLTHQLGLARDTLSGLSRFLPYGTTPHPNVLAGFAVVTFLFIIAYYQYHPSRFFTKYLLSITIGLSLIVITLTQSFSALFALIWCLTGLVISRLHFSNAIRILLCMIIITGTILISLLPSLISYHSLSFFDSGSLTIRYKLIMDSFQLIASHPLFGVGINQFVPVLIQSRLTTTAPFLQPVHNLYLLYATEVGLVGIILTLWPMITFVKRLDFGRLSPFLPLIALLIIGLADHYPYTLQTGQLCLVISAALAFHNHS